MKIVTKGMILRVIKKQYIVDVNDKFLLGQTFTKYFDCALISGKTYKVTMSFTDSISKVKGALTLETTTEKLSSSRVDTIVNNTNILVGDNKLEYTYTTSNNSNYLHIVLQNSTFDTDIEWNVKIEEVM